LEKQRASRFSGRSCWSNWWGGTKVLFAPWIRPASWASQETFHRDGDHPKGIPL